MGRAWDDGQVGWVRDPLRLLGRGPIWASGLSRGKDGGQVGRSVVLGRVCGLGVISGFLARPSAGSYPIAC